MTAPVKVFCEACRGGSVKRSPVSRPTCVPCSGLGYTLREMPDAALANIGRLRVEAARRRQEYDAWYDRTDDEPAVEYIRRMDAANDAVNAALKAYLAAHPPANGAGT